MILLRPLFLLRPLREIHLEASEAYVCQVVKCQEHSVDRTRVCSVSIVEPFIIQKPTLVKHKLYSSSDLCVNLGLQGLSLS